MVVNKLIHDTLKEQCLSIEEVVALANITEERLVSIITCQSSVSPKEASRILDALGSSLSDTICWY